MRNPRDGAAGFTLLEVLVAFAIAALALGVMFQGAVGGLRVTRAASHTQQALSIARSRLALAASDPLAARELEGDDGDGFHWRLRVAPVGSTLTRRANPEDDTGVPQVRSTLFALSVVVSWTSDGGRREVRLDSARLATALVEGS